MQQYLRSQHKISKGRSGVPALGIAPPEPVTEIVRLEHSSSVRFDLDLKSECFQSLDHDLGIFTP